jgi:aconitate hydratase
LENYAFPGELMIGTDSHTPMAGAGILRGRRGGADAVEVMAGLPWEVLFPRFIGVYLTGEISGWTAPKDVILKLAGELTVSGGTNAIIEYFGPGVRSISATGKRPLPIWARSWARPPRCSYDQRMAAYLAATGQGELAKLAEQYSHLLMADKEIEANPSAYFDRIVEIDLSSSSRTSLGRTRQTAPVLSRNWLPR